MSSRNTWRALLLLAALLAMTGVVAAKSGFDHSRSAAACAASAAPFVAAGGVALRARSVRAKLRRAESERAEAKLAVSAPGAASVVLEERRASMDLRAIDEIVRAFHGARCATGGRATADALTDLVAADARLELPDGGGRRYTERSRTVHVIGDFAVVVSAYEVERPEGTTRSVAFFQLRLGREGWRVHDAVSRRVDRAVTERLADRRPLAATDGARIEPGS